tara:strand:+ start:67 stop:336 length:270 start_codon:yes stop_codon:yes gene_type:complete
MLEINSNLSQKYLEMVFQTNNINYITLKNGRRYDIHSIEFIWCAKKVHRYMWVDLKGQTEGCNNPSLDKISERIVFHINEIDYIEIEYS